MDDIVIVSAARTPVGSFSGALGTLSGPPRRHRIAGGVRARRGRGRRRGRGDPRPGAGRGRGQNPARQAARAAGLPDAKTAFGINQVCGSGLRAVALAAQQIRTGESAIVAAGGMESMSLSQHAASAPAQRWAASSSSTRC